MYNIILCINTLNYRQYDNNEYTAVYIATTAATSNATTSQQIYTD